MPYLTFRYFSPSLQKHTQAEILLPDPAKRGPFHVMFLLHGLSDDQTIWMRRTSIERYVVDLPLIVVMPDGGRGWYADSEEGYRYETALAVELPTIIEATFHTVRPWAISGLSMGGYGALKFSIKHTDLFASAVSHSGALTMAHDLPNRDEEFNREVARALGENPVGGKDDLLSLIGTQRPSRTPHLRFDCGTDDFLLEANRAFHRHLETLQVPHEYTEHPGGHTWDYWDLHVQDGIQFHLRNLGI